MISRRTHQQASGQTFVNTGWGIVNFHFPQKTSQYDYGCF